MRLSVLLALMSVLTESLFTLMSSHLVALFLFTVWHNVLSFKWLIYSFRQIIVFAVEAWRAAFLTHRHASDGVLPFCEVGCLIFCCHFFALHHLQEASCGLECRYVVSGDCDCSVL